MEREFGSAFHAREQKPLDLGERTEPEPDVVVVAGQPVDYVHAHPTSALLLVEVAETSLSFDRRERASLYARAGVSDYWIVNLKSRQLEVHRDPAPDSSQPFGYDYRTRLVLERDDSIAPVAAPSVRIPVAELLP